MDETPDKSTPVDKAKVLKSAGQRQINLMWETTQKFIAQLVVVCSVIVSSLLSLRSLYSTDEATLSLANTALMFLVSTTSIVIGFYFGRTNHQRTGGVGSNGTETR